MVFEERKRGTGGHTVPVLYFLGWSWEWIRGLLKKNDVYVRRRRTEESPSSSLKISPRFPRLKRGECISLLSFSSLLLLHHFLGEKKKPKHKTRGENARERIKRGREKHTRNREAPQATSHNKHWQKRRKKWLGHHSLYFLFLLQLPSRHTILLLFEEAFLSLFLLWREDSSPSP